MIGGGRTTTMSLRLQRTTDVWVTWSCGAFIRWRRETDSMTHILFNAQIINIQEPSRGIGILFVCQLPQNNNNMDTHSSRGVVLRHNFYCCSCCWGWVDGVSSTKVLISLKWSRLKWPIAVFGAIDLAMRKGSISK